MAHVHWREPALPPSRGNGSHTPQLGRPAAPALKCLAARVSEVMELFSNSYPGRTAWDTLRTQTCELLPWVILFKPQEHGSAVSLHFPDGEEQTCSRLCGSHLPS